MPKVTIRELDYTGVPEYNYLDNVVLVPGIKLEYEDTANNIVYSLDNDGQPYETADSFKSKFDEIIKKLRPDSGELPIDYASDFGIIEAYECLKMGLSVQYTGVYCDIDERTESGVTVRYPVDKDGAELTKTDIEESIRDFSDRGKYDLRFLVSGGFRGLNKKIEADPTVGETDSISYEEFVQQGIISVAAKRGDAVALLDVPQDKKKADDIKDWVETEFLGTASEVINRDGVSWTTNEECYGKYAAMFAPYFLTNYNSINGDVVKDAIFPASLYYLSCFAKNEQLYNSWSAMAGSQRGKGTYSCKPLVKFGDNDAETLQRRTTDDPEKPSLAVNIICEIRPFGYVMWGNRTMYPTNDKLKASAFLNIRQLCSQIKKQLYRTARKYTFETNSSTLWIKFMSELTPLLDKMKVNSGVRDYRIVKIPTSQKALLSARIEIVPVEAVEDFDLSVELTDEIVTTEE